MRKFIYSYNPHSEGARNLAQALGISRIKHHGSNYQPRPGDTIIRWGTGGDRVFPDFVRVLNPTNVVKRASNKLTFFQHLDGSSVLLVPWTADRTVVEGWLTGGHTVFARTVLSGHSGEGIVIIEPGSGLDFVQAPLYTKYVKKEKEFRVHCAFGACIDVQRKIRRPGDLGPTEWRIRNHQNGFIYVRNDIQVPEEVTSQALQAIKATGLDFGAIDVLWNSHEGKAYVLEINTAPGITGSTVVGYKNAFTTTNFGLQV